VCEHLEAVTAGEIPNLLINIPPRYTKSLVVTVGWPTWEWLLKPSTQYIFNSYAASLSLTHSRYRRLLIESDWYQHNWGDRYKLSVDQNTKSEFENSSRGAMLAISTGGGLGRGGDRIVMDDPHNPRVVESDTERQAVIDHYDLTLCGRLNSATGSKVLVMQRLHEKDLTGHILAKEGLVKDGGQWEHIKLEALATKPTIVIFPRSHREIKREINDALCPARHTTEQFKKLQVNNPRLFAPQYQQTPTPAGGGVVEEGWWRHYQGPKEASWFDRIVLSWDMAFKDTKTSSYVVGQVWGQKGADKYLLHQVRRHMSFTETLKAFSAQCNDEKWQAFLWAKIVEDKANGTAVLDTLKKKIPGLIAFDPSGMGSKEARAHAVAPEIEAGNVYLPDPDEVPWVKLYKQEWSYVPKGEFWDQVDATTQALLYFRMHAITQGSVEVYKNDDYQDPFEEFGNLGPAAF